MQRIEIDNSKKPNFIGAWNINDNVLCKNLIDYFESNTASHKKGLTGAGADEKIKKSIDLRITAKTVNENNILKEYMNKIHGCYLDYLEQWSFLKTFVKEVEIGAFNIQKYETGGHFGSVHSERTSLKSAHRIFVFMTYLNDVEGGGCTTFDYFGIKVKPELGKTIIWPAEWTHAHAGETVTYGNKYIITGWMHFPVS